mmetsp:Transcript_15171/g.12921  ORF Transcript_15171/g.12921 Transcript_15171/m.12921 type:complete len:84 (-) Transcript_15171:649-900(-)
MQMEDKSDFERDLKTLHEIFPGLVSEYQKKQGGGYRKESDQEQVKRAGFHAYPEQTTTQGSPPPVLGISRTGGVQWSEMGVWG